MALAGFLWVSQLECKQNRVHSYRSDLDVSDGCEPPSQAVWAAKEWAESLCAPLTGTPRGSKLPGLFLVLPVRQGCGGEGSAGKESPFPLTGFAGVWMRAGKSFNLPNHLLLAYLRIPFIFAGFTSLCLPLWCFLNFWLVLSVFIL